MGLASAGRDIRHAHFLLTLFLISAFFSNLGIVLITRAKRFVDFALWCAGVLMLMALPLFDWFGVFPLPFKVIFPLEHGVRLLAYSMHYELDAVPFLSYLVLLAFTVATYFWVHRRFTTANHKS